MLRTPAAAAAVALAEQGAVLLPPLPQAGRLDCAPAHHAHAHCGGDTTSSEWRVKMVHGVHVRAMRGGARGLRRAGRLASSC